MKDLTINLALYKFATCNMCIHEGSQQVELCGGWPASVSPPPLQRHILKSG